MKSASGFDDRPDVAERRARVLQLEVHRGDHVEDPEVVPQALRQRRRARPSGLGQAQPWRPRVPKRRRVDRVRGGATRASSGASRRRYPVPLDSRCGGESDT